MRGRREGEQQYSIAGGPTGACAPARRAAVTRTVENQPRRHSDNERMDGRTTQVASRDTSHDQRSEKPLGGNSIEAARVQDNRTDEKGWQTQKALISRLTVKGRAVTAFAVGVDRIGKIGPCCAHEVGAPARAGDQPLAEIRRRSAR